MTRPMEIQDLYMTQQEALASLVLAYADRSGDQVPACPAWTVNDLLAHVVGLSSDAVTGMLPVIDLLEQWRDDNVVQSRDRMTADQVDRVAGESVEELVSQWREMTPTLAAMLSGAIPFPDPAPFGLAAILVTDLVIHDQDVRGALGVHNAPGGPASSLALATYFFSVTIGYVSWRCRPSEFATETKRAFWELASRLRPCRGPGSNYSAHSAAGAAGSKFWPSTGKVTQAHMWPWYQPTANGRMPSSNVTSEVADISPRSSGQRSAPHLNQPASV